VVSQVHKFREGEASAESEGTGSACITNLLNEAAADAQKISHCQLAVATKQSNVFVFEHFDELLVFRL